MLYWQRYLVVTWLVLYNHTPYIVHCHHIESHMFRLHVCLDVSCHLHFWQNDQDLLRAIAVTREWNGYRNKIQHRKMTLEKKILPSHLRGLDPETFRSRVRRSTTELSPNVYLKCYWYVGPTCSCIEEWFLNDCDADYLRELHCQIWVLPSHWFWLDQIYFSSNSRISEA